MRRRVLGYSTVVDELKKGNCILSAPMSDNDFIIIGKEICTVRNDFFSKAFKANMGFTNCYQKGSYTKEIRLA